MSNDRRWSAGDEAPQAQPAPSNPVPPQSAPTRSLGIDAFCVATATASRGGIEVAGVKEMFELISKEYKSKVADGATVHVVVADEAPLLIPAVILYCVKGKDIYAYPMLLEACGEPLPPEQVPNRPIMIDRPTWRYYPGTMERMCNERVRVDAVSKALVRNDAQVLPVTYVVIKRTINLKDQKELSAYFDSAMQAFRAYERVQNKIVTCERDFNYRKIKEYGLNMVSKHQITPGATARDAFGNFCAQDFKVDLVLRENDRSNIDLHKNGREITVSSLTGYVDFAFHEPDATQHQHARQQAALNQQYNPVIIPGYDPYLVITSASTLGNSTVFGDNILTAAMAFASLNGIAQGQRWATIFGRGGLDKDRKASLGAFALEHDVSFVKPRQKQILPVSAGFEASNGTAMSPLEVISKYCYNSMLIAIDVEEGGTMKWLLEIFGNATRGSVQEALIINELDHFTDNKFSQIWDRSQPIAAYEPVMIHLGFYPDGDAANKRDIRTLDYPSMLTYTQGDEDLMRAYSTGLLPGQNSAEVQHAKREVLKMVKPGVEITGIAKRYFINSAFINAMDAAFAACQLQITLEGIGDIVSALNRPTAFGGTFNAPITSHGTFTQNINNQNGSTPIQFASNNWFSR